MSKLIKVVLLFLASATCLFVGATTNSHTETNKVAQSRFVLPRILTYGEFTRLFRRHYTTAVEFAQRQRIFIGRLCKVFISSISYESNKTGTYLSINRMSDWTDQERRQLISGENDDDIEANIVYHVHPNDLVTDQASITGERAARNKNQREMASSRSDIVRYDLRQTGCFNEPQHQGKCGSCYALTAIAQLEFLHCIRGEKLPQRQPIKLSEQYLIDCGKAWGHTKGCRGGKLTNVLSFASIYGIKLSQHYHGGQYLAEEQNCPIDPGNEANYIEHSLRIRNNKTFAFEHKELEEAFKLNLPLYVSIKANPMKFMDYGGGVDLELDCTARHAMLLVGSGTDDGHEYWLLRNSFGAEWGEAGHFRMSKQSTCFNNEGRGYFPAFAAPKKQT